VNDINQRITLALTKYEQEEDKGLKWDLIKMEIRSSTICYAKSKAKETRDNIKQAIVDYEQLEKEICNQPSDETLQKYHETKIHIEQYNNEKANGVILRSKADWAEFGEKNSKFFLNLEKRNHNMKCITKLIKEDNKEITNSEEILKYEEEFYKNLYSEPPKNNLTIEQQQKNTDSFINNTLPKLTEIDRHSCEGAMTLKEIGSALKELKNGKSPGSDGFTPDFYKFFWPKIKQVVFDGILYFYFPRMRTFTPNYLLYSLFI
jgi:hypothetical protein